MLFIMPGGGRSCRPAQLESRALASSCIRAASPLFLAALAACGGSPGHYQFDRAAFRAEAIAECSSGLQMGSAAAAVADRVCACGTDQFIAGRPDASLASLTWDEKQQGLHEAVRQCLARERDLGPIPADMARPAATPTDAVNGSDEVPMGVGAPPAAPGANSVSGDATANTVESDLPGPSDANSSRWHQPPR